MSGRPEESELRHWNASSYESYRKSLLVWIDEKTFIDRITRQISHHQCESLTHCRLEGLDKVTGYHPTTKTTTTAINSHTKEKKSMNNSSCQRKTISSPLPTTTSFVRLPPSSNVGLLKLLLVVLSAVLFLSHDSMITMVGVVRAKPIALVTPDSSNTKLRINPLGLSFLKQLPAPLAIVAVGGRARTGKSFMLNQILNVEDGKRDGFLVGITSMAGTKGLLLWDKPQTIPLPNCKSNSDGDVKSSPSTSCNLTVVYMDTEGLGQVGGTTDSHDSKICALSVLLSSLFIYNVNHDIFSSDINLLYSVVALSEVYKANTTQPFPFPPILWTVQQFEHELNGSSPNDVLKRALTEIPPTNDTINSLEIMRYNQTVRTVKNQFPVFLDSTKILLMNRPHHCKMSQLPDVRRESYVREYVEQIDQLRNLIHTQLTPKAFSSNLTAEDSSGEFMAKMLESVVEQMNNVQSIHFGAALVREVSKQLKERAWTLYLVAMNKKAPLPQSEETLRQVHNEESIRSLEHFEQKCPGGLKRFGNDELYKSLNETIESWFEYQLGTNNTAVARAYYNDLVNTMFERVWKGNYTVDSFDLDESQITNEYTRNARGPKYIQDKALQNMLEKLNAKRMNLLHQEARQDLTSMLVICIALFLFSYVFYYPISLSGVSNRLPFYVPLFLVMTQVSSMVLFLWLLALHLNFVQDPTDSAFSFTNIQLIYRALRCSLTELIILAAIAVFVLFVIQKCCCGCCCARRRAAVREGSIEEHHKRKED